MKILVVGAYGDIGKVVCDEFGTRHDLVRVGRSRGDYLVDVSDRSAVDRMYDALGEIDAVVSTAGDVKFAPLAEQTSKTMAFALQQKVMGQINLVLSGLTRLSDQGSFTLTSGILDRDPIPMAVGAATANGALGGFVKGAAIEMPRGFRINVVSPGLLEVSEPRYGALFAGHNPVSSKRVARAYAKSVEGARTGQVIIVD
ncbi:MAG: short chain dehydrogenase [Pseudomonadota bacterium]